jgi:PEP-CTERM motif
VPGFSDGVFLDNFRFEVAAVPEPSTWAMMLIGFAGLGFAGCKQTKRRAIVA